MRARIPVLVLCFLAIRPGFADMRLYNVVGTEAGTAQRRQLLNEEAMQSINGALHREDCDTKLDAMAVNAFTFFRGSNVFFYRDMHDQKTVENSDFYDSKATPWIQGDMHVLNAGCFDNDEGKAVYDMNDFDESFVANYLYDVYRLATSIVLVARLQSMPSSDVTSCVKMFAKSYRDQLKALAEDDTVKPFSYDTDRATGLIKDLLKKVERSSSAELRKKMLDKWSAVDKGSGKRYFITDGEGAGDHASDLAAISKDDYKEIERAVVDYYTDTVTSSSLQGNAKYFKIRDIAARKNAGTGSLGTSRYYILIAGDSKGPDTDRILDVKLQSKPAVYKYLDEEQREAVDRNVRNDADRAVRAYKSLLRRTDDHLGYMEIHGKFFSVRERSPYKKTLNLSVPLELEDLQTLSQQWGIMLANAHQRSSKGNGDLGVPPSFAQVFADLTKGKRGEFAQEIADVAANYAFQVEHDYSLFRDSMSRGPNRLC